LKEKRVQKQTEDSASTVEITEHVIKVGDNRRGPKEPTDKETTQKENEEKGSKKEKERRSKAGPKGTYRTTGRSDSDG